ncbi:related to receptor-like protein kinase 5 precursor [Cephalotrichum gorgonifer]|uniref:Related to receptor-like protein kinase 5 n=1 Tax=Cephalotrichum gorgonifer TaxID=2041049 RepID=A0AAE8T0J6_9PEZI|nr:related to receptor-like protein kinase 5 precursor [Cephalotrichum gorgonifer]
MDDQPASAPAPAPGRPSGIPRPSRLPVPSSIPRPAPNTLRTAASRESLSLSTADLRDVSRASSRESNTSSLAGRKSNAPAVAHPQLRPARSRPSLRHAASASHLDQSQPPLPKKAPDASRRLSGLPLGNAPAPVGAKRTTNRRTSGMYNLGGSAAPVPSYAQTQPPRRASPPDAADRWAAEPGPFETPKKRAPSLAERTIETLSQIPSSPAVSRRPSAFFDQRPRSRASSSASRPGSSLGDAGLRRSRTNSISGPDDALRSHSPPSPNMHRPPLPTIDGTPHKALKPRASVHSLRSPSLRSPSATVVHGPTALPSPRGSELERSPSPTKQSAPPRQPALSPPSMASKPLRLKPSSSLLVKKGGSNQAPGRAPRKVSAFTNKPITPTKMAPPPALEDLDAPNSPSPTMVKARKSSAALREQIAKARAAAKKSALPPATEDGGDAPAPAVASGFDFGFDDEPLSNDPFNQGAGENSQTKMLQQRAAMGRTTGRLNIAALGLKEIPAEVMDMYDLSAGGNSGSWAESVDITKLVAADNEFEVIADAVFPDVDSEALADDEDGKGSIFGGVEMIDLHGNQLVSLPMGLRRLGLLTSLNLSQNRLPNGSLDIISQIPTLRELKLANNLLDGALPACLSDLVNLEILDLHGNKISALPPGVESLSRIRVLNVGENRIESLPFESLSVMPLVELVAKSNKLSGTLIEDSVAALPSLQTLDISANQLKRVVSPGRTVGLPALRQLTLSVNRLQGLPDVSSWTSLTSLMADENSIEEIPEGFTTLECLKHVDFTSNNIRVVPAEVARMDGLATLRISGNPLRDKKFASISTDELKEILAARLEPPPPYHVGIAQTTAVDAVQFDEEKMATTTNGSATMPVPAQEFSEAAENNADDGAGSSDFDHYATPPTSPSRSRAQTLSKEVTWPVKAGGLLDRSGTESSSLHPVITSRVAAENRVTQVHLHRNLFSTFPESLSFFAGTLTALSLAHNQLVGESYLGEPLELPALKELNLASNHVTSLAPLTANLTAPMMEKLDVSLNRITELPMPPLRSYFPALAVLLVANNHLSDLDPEAIRGMRVVDASNNDIAHLNPRLGLLGGPGGLERLEVRGNRFRVPRFSIIERGTETTLRWLRGRVPAAEVSIWRAGREGSEEEELD